MDEGKVRREELFVITKLWIDDAREDSAGKAFETSLAKLGLDYIDLYLVHQPYGDYYGAWRAMEKLYEEGRIRALGVSNFSSERLVDLCMNSHIPPMVNQVELHPFYHQEQALHIMRELGVQPQAWAPLCEGLRNIFPTKCWKRSGRNTAGASHRPP